MNETAAPTPNHNPGDTVEVDNLDHFVTILTGWHTKKVAILEHMANVPEGTVMTTEGGTDVVMKGEFRVGFKAGIGLALMELGSLPFAAEAEPEVASDAPANEK